MRVIGKLSFQAPFDTFMFIVQQRLKGSSLIIFYTLYSMCFDALVL